MKPDKSKRLREASPTADPSAAWEPIFSSLGLPAYQVKTDGKTVAIQAPPEDHPRLLAPKIRTALVEHGKGLGYRFITLELG